MTVRFEIGTSVTLVGQDLQFIGLKDGVRIRFLVTNDALKRLAGSAKELSPQQKFQAYDRNREWLQNIASELFAQTPNVTRTIKIGVTNLVA